MHEMRAVVVDLAALADGEKWRSHAADALRTVQAFALPDGAPVAVYVLFPAADLAEVRARVAALGLAEVLEHAGERTLRAPIDREPTRDEYASILKPHALDAGSVLRIVAAGGEAGSQSPPPGIVLGVSRGFDDWRMAPLELARRFFTVEANLHPAVELILRTVEMGVESLTAPERAGGDIVGRGRAWVALDDPGLDDLDGVRVQLPGHWRISAANRLEVDPPETEMLAEAATFVRSLIAHGNIHAGAGAPNPGCTHVIETDERGRRRLVRRGFS